MRDSTRRTVRTVVQAAVAIGQALPGLIAADTAAAAVPWLVEGAAVAGVLARAMASPGVQRWLPQWLRTGPGDGVEELARRDRAAP